MATAGAGFSNLRTTPSIFCSVTPQPNNPNTYPNRPNLKPSSSANWWAPVLFGWSSDPDYIQSSTTTTGENIKKKSESGREQEDSKRVRVSRSRFALGSFTDEKAKELRKMTRETSSFHDVMYHSAIASRLACDVDEDSKEG